MNESVPLGFPWRVKSSLGSSTSNGGTSVVSQTLSGTWLTARTRSGTSNPGFRQKIALLQDATTTFAGTNVKVKSSPFSFAITWSAPYAGLRNYEAADGNHQITGTFSNPATLSLTVADNEAKRKVIAEVWKRRAAFQGGTFLAELRQTIRGIKQPLRSLREGLDAYHRAAKKLYRQRGRAGFQSALSGTWLEFQFGFLQNARDIESGLGALKAMGKARALRFKANGKSSVSSTPSPMFASPCPGMSSYIKQHMYKTETVIVIYRGAYKANLPYGWDVDSWGINTQDFIPAVWEAIPYSFVIDYFTNVGQIIQSYSGILCDIAWVAKTIRKEVSYLQQGVELIPFNRSYPIKFKDIGSLGSTEVALSNVYRSASSVSGLIPRLQLKVPEAGSLKWLNLAALVRLRTL